MTSSDKSATTRNKDIFKEQSFHAGLVCNTFQSFCATVGDTIKQTENAIVDRRARRVIDSFRAALNNDIKKRGTTRVDVDSPINLLPKVDRKLVLGRAEHEHPYPASLRHFSRVTKCNNSLDTTIPSNPVKK